MLSYNFFKENIIIFLFIISIFFSHTVLTPLDITVEGSILMKLNFNIPLRFIFLITIFFLVFDYFKLKKFPKKNIIVALIAVSLIFLHSFINQIYLIENFEYTYNAFVLDQVSLVKKLLLKCGVIFLSILILIEYKNILYKNIFKLINGYLLIVFILYIKFYYENSEFLNTYTNNQTYLLDLLIGCNQGFFYETNFLYKENSHFHLLSPVIIIYFAYNFKNYFKYKFLFLLNIFFALFTFFNFSLTFYLGINLGIIAIFIFCRNLDKISSLGLVVLLAITNAIFFKDSSESYCDATKTRSEAFELRKEFIPGQRTENFFFGGIETPRVKLWANGLTGKTTIGLSGSIVLYNIQFAIKNLIKHPLGAGMGNYEVVYTNNIRFDEQMGLDGEQIFRSEDHVPPRISEKKFPKLHAGTLHYNNMDGSINFAKLVTEFGFFAIFAFLYILYKVLKLDLTNDFKLIIICFLVPQIFVRASGYFYNGFFIWAILLIIIISMRNENTNKLN